MVLERSGAPSWTMETTWIPVEKEYESSIECLKRQSEIIFDLRQKLAQVEKEKSILQELVDRPDRVGSRIAYQEAKNLLL